MTHQRRVLTLLWIEFFTAYLDRTNIAVAGPTLMKSLAITPQLFGYVLAAFTAGYAVMQVPGGILADRFGVRRVLVAALLVWSLFTGLTALAASAGALILIRFCFGLGEGIESGAHFRALGDTFSSRERSTASGILHTSLALGPAVAAPLAAAIIGAHGWQALFIWFTVPGVIVAALVWRYFPKTTGRPSSREAAASGNPLQRGPRLWWMFAAYLCFNVAFWGLAGWMPSYLSSERHIELKSLGVAASVPYLFGFAGLLVLGWVARTLLYERRAQLVAGAYVLAGLSLFIAFRAGDVVTCITGLSIAAFFLYGSFAPFWAVSLDLVPEGSHGAISGFVNLGGQIGGFFAPIAVGAFVGATHSYAGGFALMACALIAGACAVLFAHGALRYGDSVMPAITIVQ
jgi:sugar phosphate permease